MNKKTYIRTKISNKKQILTRPFDLFKRKYRKETTKWFHSYFYRISIEIGCKVYLIPHGTL